VSARLNLASQPFRNHTLPWTIASIITIASIVALVFIFVKSREMNRQAAVVERDVTTLRQQWVEYEKKVSELRQALTPEQQQLHDAAHGLVDRKRFSWSRLFADLEANTPNNVRVSRINVRDVGTRGGQTVADLELSVISKDPAEVTGMMSKMNSTGVFRADLVSQNPSKGRGEGAEWVLSVRYTQRIASSG
jgi:Tfp pilus assembly protein PilN